MNQRKLGGVVATPFPAAKTSSYCWIFALDMDGADVTGQAQSTLPVNESWWTKDSNVSLLLTWVFLNPLRCLVSVLRGLWKQDSEQVAP